MEVEVLGKDDQVAVLGGAPRQQVLGEQRQPPRELERALVHPAAELRGEVLVLHEQVEVAGEAGERGPQLVADHGDDVVAVLGRVDQLGDPVAEVAG